MKFSMTGQEEVTF